MHTTIPLSRLARGLLACGCGAEISLHGLGAPQVSSSPQGDV